MEIRQLRYFLAVAREGSFSAASQRIHVAQPALSAQIAKLEAELGQPLFERHPRGVNLTEVGRSLFGAASDIVGTVDEVVQSIRAQQDGSPLVATLGVPPLVSMMLTVPLVEAVARELPHVSLQVIEGMSGALKGWLADQSIDLAFLHNVDPATPNAHVVVREDLYVAASRDYPVRLGPEIHTRDLIRLPVIASTPRNSHRQLLEAIGRRYGANLIVAAEVDSIPRQRELVWRGIGVLVMPLAGFTDWAGDDLQLARLYGADVVWDTSIVAAETPGGQRALQTLKSVILRLVDELVRAGRWPGVQSNACDPAPRSRSSHGSVSTGTYW